MVAARCSQSARRMVAEGEEMIVLFSMSGAGFLGALTAALISSVRSLAATARPICETLVSLVLALAVGGPLVAMASSSEPGSPGTYSTEPLSVICPAREPVQRRMPPASFMLGWRSAYSSSAAGSKGQAHARY